MKFAPRELCQKLQEMGCVSESGFNYVYDHRFGNDRDIPISEDQFIVKATNFHGFLEEVNHTPAFCFEDFAGTHEQARENAKIAWGDDYYCEPDKNTEPIKIQRQGADWHRHAMIDSEDWVTYLQETMK